MSLEDAQEFSAKMESHYAAVGKVASNRAAFEQRIQWAIWNIAELDNLTGACITTQIGNSGRMIDAMIALLRLRGATEKSINPLNKFAEKVGNKQRQRNRIVHDPWLFKFPSGEAARDELSAKRELISTHIHHPTIYFRTLSSNGTPSSAEAKAADWRDIVDICVENREADIGRFLRPLGTPARSAL